MLTEIQAETTELEQQVMDNSQLLDAQINQYVASHKGQYIVFHENKHYFVNDLDEAETKGIAEFGEDTGFVIKKITDNPTQPAIFSTVIIGS